VERVLEALGGELPASALYGILKLRAEVFVVEQACVYLDPDGRDLEPSTRHLWVEDEPSGAVVCALRVLHDADGTASIGRVVTAPAHRSRGRAAQLVRTALATTPARPVRINAQSQLVDWYAGLGFEVAGDEFVEDGIAHTPMAITT
jgi:ElaA protein